VSLALNDALRTAAETLVLAVVIYAFIRFLQETRGSAVLKGLVVVVVSVVVVFVALVQTLELERLRWLAERGFGGLVFALIVVFQPEIRQALVSLGESPLVRGLARGRRQTRAEEIVEAAFALAARGFGALILVERDDGLGGLAEGAVRLDASLSSALLATVFHKDTPLHDGAVLVRGDRIVAAGCLLPLSGNPNLAQTLGTRHRAALGATEESDAIAVVVSEETRRVSVARRGALELGVTPARLRELLEGPAADEVPEPAAKEAAA
jgi:diadenylate cyclase